MANKKYSVTPSALLQSIKADRRKLNDITMSCKQCRDALDAVENATGISKSEILSKKRISHIANARKIAIYISVMGGDLTHSHVSRQFQLDRTSVDYVMEFMKFKRSKDLKHPLPINLINSLLEIAKLVFGKLQERKRKAV